MSSYTPENQTEFLKKQCISAEETLSGRVGARRIRLQTAKHNASGAGSFITLLHIREAWRGSPGYSTVSVTVSVMQC